MDMASLSASPRTATGKGPARQLRRQGLIPAIFYGPGRDPRPLSVNSKDLRSIFLSGQHNLIRLTIQGDEAGEEKTVMLKDHQLHPVKRNLLHADFYEIDVNRPIETEVPLVLLGKPIGTDKGGLLQQIRVALTISALPLNVPMQIEVDISHLDLGDSLHVEELLAPEGVEIPYETNFTLATVAAPKGIKAEEEVEGEEGEGSAEEDEAS
ncbi:MAG: 50S ribosomal protein L25 [Proteobacteria bacterium]|nr:50S ribosomal protein L25 [Pseudomonadota bacterium]